MMNLMNRLFFLPLFLLLACGPSRQVAVQQITPERKNRTETLDKPYVVLVSIDGFRHDYVEKYELPTFPRIAKAGISAEAVIPAFPSKTFPNHYTIATGLYPANHGLVANTFYDPARKATYQIRDREKVEDGSWYGGTPIWNLAEQQGMLSACFFWVGSEADIQGILPTYYHPYDGRVPHEARIDQVIAWLNLPAEKRPHLITLYFSEIDSKGHAFGPDSKEVEHALQDIDRSIADLDARLAELDLPIHLLLTSDHGMTRIDQENLLRLQDMIELEPFEIAANGSVYMLYSEDSAAVELAYEQLSTQADRFSVYRKAEIPAHLHFANNPRIGEILLLAKAPYVFTHTERSSPPSPGAHGYDPREVPDMNTIFYAKGPAFREGLVLPPFENIHLYPLMAALLGLTPPAVDGKLEVLQPSLK
jgi:predicted AlkP superfamily pyrophosphatase or phosphodiesterase